ncbi:MAG: EF-P lysine aminoacylase GenX [Gammaproteobacteria bacterium]|nr:MAG: EF-P lysine aminoacylase GenX [Gammaproteobacteria bacterium]
MKTDWRPGADREALQARARLLRQVRAFFDQRGLLEVDTPLLCRFGASEPQIEGLSCGPRHLQTSPEYAMKRLLAAGVGDCWQVCHAFRGGELGALHNPEFTLLEWYRIGYDHYRLMDEVEALLGELLGPRLSAPAERLAYAEVFRRHLDIDPFTGDQAQLEAAAGDVLPETPLDRDGLLELLMALRIQPRLPDDRLTFIHDWPLSQAALARVLPGDPPRGARFEVYLGAVELGNGYWELTNATEQARRFEADNRRRRAAGRAEVTADPYLLAALESGLPDCAGVAIGLDRVLMLQLGRATLDEVLSFSWERC